jgi:hypothetical protein
MDIKLEPQRSIPRLSDIDLRAGSRGQRLRVCVVTSEITGPTKNGGIGTATSGLVEHLAGDGHQVTVLYTQVWENTPLCTERSWQHWVRELAAKGVDLSHIPHSGSYADWRHKAWLVKDHLGQGEYDLVYFNEHHGSGYYALAAKRAGLSPFAEQIHCVITHGSIEWVLNTNDQYIERVSDLEMIGFERRTVEWADFVIGPSEYLLKEYAGYGWRLPARTYCQPYPLMRAPAVFDAETRPIEGTRLLRAARGTQGPLAVLRGSRADGGAAARQNGHLLGAHDRCLRLFLRCAHSRPLRQLALSGKASDPVRTKRGSRLSARREPIGGHALIGRQQPLRRL